MIFPNAGLWIRTTDFFKPLLPSDLPAGRHVTQLDVGTLAPAPTERGAWLVAWNFWPLLTIWHSHWQTISLFWEKIGASGIQGFRSPGPPLLSGAGDGLSQEGPQGPVDGLAATLSWRIHKPQGSYPFNRRTFIRRTCAPWAGHKSES